MPLPDLINIRFIASLFLIQNLCSAWLVCQITVRSAHLIGKQMKPRILLQARYCLPKNLSVVTESHCLRETDELFRFPTLHVVFNVQMQLTMPFQSPSSQIGSRFSELERQHRSPS